MVKGPLSRGGTQECEVADVARGSVVVIAKLSTGQEVILNPDEGAYLVEKNFNVIINYRQNSDHPTLSFFRGEELIHSEAVPAENIRLMAPRFF